MDFRHEWKHEITFSDRLTIRQRMRAVARSDPHAIEGKYFIRSLYFDNREDKVLREKTEGVGRREKFRIRYYNGDPSLIHLEKKSKVHGLCRKESTVLSAKEVEEIIQNGSDWIPERSDPLLLELAMKMRIQGLRAKTIVDYTREPFVYEPGNVRITIDFDIRTGLLGTDFLDPDCVTMPVPGNPILLEVKWDEFLPSVIRDAVMLEGRIASAYSKYAACRIYG